VSARDAVAVASAVEAPRPAAPEPAARLQLIQPVGRSYIREAPPDEAGELGRVLGTVSWRTRVEPDAVLDLFLRHAL
jgi:hypothetical protein